jgi:hypothetical protein
LQDRLTGEAESVRGPLEAQPPHVLFHAFAHHPAERAMKVVG